MLTDRARPWHAALVLSLFFIACIMLMGQSPIGDYGNYYYASKLLLRGDLGAWIYEPSAFNLAIYNEGQRDFFLSYTPVPPFSILAYLPFAFTGISLSKAIWIIVTAAYFIWVLLKAQRFFNVPPAWLMVLPLLFFTPARNNIIEGQSYFLVTGMLLHGFMLRQQGRVVIAMLCWAICIHLKIFPAIVFAFLLFEKDSRSVAWLLLLVAGVFLLSLPVLGEELWWNYLTDILPRIADGEINHTYALNYQSMQVLLKTMFVPDALHSPNAPFNSTYAYTVLLRAFKMIIVLLTFFAARSTDDPFRKFGLWLVAGLLLTGYGTVFSLVLLFIPFLSLLKQPDKRAVMVSFILVFLICNISFRWFEGLPLPLRFPRLWLLLALWIFMISRTSFGFRPAYFAALLLVVIIPARQEHDGSMYVLDREKALLVYDYKIAGNSLMLSYFDKDGPQQYEQQLPFTAHTVHPVEAIGLPSALEKEKVVRPVLVNDSLVFYLSDKNRGVGFYTLRQLVLDKK